MVDSFLIGQEIPTSFLIHHWIEKFMQMETKN